MMTTLDSQLFGRAAELEQEVNELMYQFRNLRLNLDTCLPSDNVRQELISRVDGGTQFDLLAHENALDLLRDQLSIFIDSFENNRYNNFGEDNLDSLQSKLNRYSNSYEDHLSEYRRLASQFHSVTLTLVDQLLSFDSLNNWSQ